MTNTKTYIGDGVYVEFTGYDFILSTERENGFHYIHLEPHAIKELNNFCDQMKGAKND